jgi:hypothetical protein
MKRQLRKYIAECDGCRKRVRYTSEFRDSLPSGWGYVQSHGWGMTDYTRTLEVCEECLAKKPTP